MRKRPISDPKILTGRDVILAGGCVEGIRDWFEAHSDKLPEGLTLRSFLKDGARVEDLQELKEECGFLKKILERKENNYGR